MTRPTDDQILERGHDFAGVIGTLLEELLTHAASPGPNGMSIEGGWVKAEKLRDRLEEICRDYGVDTSELKLCKAQIRSLGWRLA